MKTAKRFTTNEVAHIEIYGNIGILKVIVKNLSSTGAFLEVAHGSFVPRKGDLLNMTVQLSSLRRTHNVSAEVVWSENRTMGVCFINKEQVLERMMAKSNDI